MVPHLVKLTTAGTATSADIIPSSKAWQRWWASDDQYLPFQNMLLRMLQCNHPSVFVTCKQIQSATLTPYSCNEESQFQNSFAQMASTRPVKKSYYSQTFVYSFSKHLHNKTVLLFVCHQFRIIIVIKPGVLLLLSALGQCRCQSHLLGSIRKTP